MQKCSNYNITSIINRFDQSISVSNTINSTSGIEYIYNDFDWFFNTLENLLAHKKTLARRRVRVENIKDKNNSVKFICNSLLVESLLV